MSWVIAEKGKFPCDHSTVCCPKRIYEGQVAVTIPLHGVGNFPLDTSIVVHQKCLARFLTKVPDDFAIIQERIAEMKKEFIRK